MCCISYTYVYCAPFELCIYPVLSCPSLLQEEPWTLVRKSVSVIWNPNPVLNQTHAMVTVTNNQWCAIRSSNHTLL